MKKFLAIISFGLISSSFGLDEYLSIEKGKVEVDFGYSYVHSTGLVNNNGKKHDYLGDLSPTQNLIPLQVKYGLIQGLDLELATNGTFSNKDWGALTRLSKELKGFSQPQLAAKYTLADLNAGAYLNVVLPFATGNLDNPDPSLGLGLGAVYANRFGDFRFTGTAGYQINFENDDKFKRGNLITIYAKPEAMWTEYIGTYVGIKYLIGGESEFNGNSIKDSEGFVLTVIPGVNAKLLNWLAYEVNVPYDLMGKNGPATWGISGNIYATLPM